MSQLKGHHAGRVPSYLAFVLYSGLHYPTLEGTNLLTESTDSDVNLIQNHPHRYTQNNV